MTEWSILITMDSILRADGRSALQVDCGHRTALLQLLWYYYLEETRCAFAFCFLFLSSGLVST